MICDLVYMSAVKDGERLVRRARRAMRVRYKLRKASAGCLRMSVYRSGRYLYVQVIDDVEGKTLFAASTRCVACDCIGGDCSGAVKRSSRCNIKYATALGAEVAKKVISAGVKRVVFDRGGYAYHGRVKAIADAARNEGLIL